MNYYVKINLSKVDKKALFTGEKTTVNSEGKEVPNVYLDAVLFVNDEADQFGNNGSIIQSYPVDQRTDEKNYIGNIKLIQKKTGETETAPDVMPPKPEDDLPF